MISLAFPFTEQKIRALKVGDEVLISGVLFTGAPALICQKAQDALYFQHENAR